MTWSSPLFLINSLIHNLLEAPIPTAATTAATGRELDSQLVPVQLGAVQLAQNFVYLSTA